MPEHKPGIEGESSFSSEETERTQKLEAELRTLPIEKLLQRIEHLRRTIEDSEVYGEGASDKGHKRLEVMEHVLEEREKESGA